MGAALLALVGDAEVAGRIVCRLSGLTSLGLSVALADRLADRRVALSTALLLCLQPEFALYASTTLREPPYSAAVMLCLLALVNEKMLWAGLAASLAFLVRMDGAAVLGPLLLLHGLGRGPRLQRCLAGLLPLAATIFAWSAYCRWDHGTWLFWSHSVNVNIETGMGAEAEEPGSWTLAGLSVVGGLAAWLLPWRIGWAPWAGLWLALARLPWARHDPRRSAGLLALGLGAFWCGIGFIAQHAPSHNLYWKWMYPLVPVVLPLGMAGLWAAADRLPAALRLPAVALAIVQIGWSYPQETRRQLQLSEQLYRPQVELARWLEAEVPEEVPLVWDNIPACYINRRSHERRMISWFDVPNPSGDPSAFAAWLRAERIGYVLWFREDWTQAPLNAPFLAAGGAWEADGLRLVEQRREDSYGWILYAVEQPALDAPSPPE
jgi:hypothetical protein